MAIEDYIKRVEDWNMQVRLLRMREPVVPSLTVKGADPVDHGGFDFMFHVNLTFEAVSIYIGSSDMWNIFENVPFGKFPAFVTESELFTEEVKCQISEWWQNIE